MAALVRARRPVAAPPVRVIRASMEPIIVRVDQATWIPSGMHGGSRQTYATATLIPTGMHEFVDKRRQLDYVVEKLIAEGVDPMRARILTDRAAVRFSRNQGNGLGDEAADSAASDASARLSKIMSDAQGVQNSHRQMVANMASWEDRKPGWVTTDDDLRLTFQDQLTGLKDSFVQRSLPVLGVDFPYQIDRVDPAGAIVLSVRDDIQNTIDLLDARKSQQVLQKTISDLSKIPLPSVPPSINLPGLPNIPWYVWGAGIGVGALALKQMLSK